jgi:hypothetical protein
VFYVLSTRASQIVQSLVAGLTPAERARRGASLVEYVLLVSLMALACVVGLKYLGSQTARPYSGAASGLEG